MKTSPPVIILIHGYGFDERIWNPVELAFNRFEVLRFSLPGFGSDPFPAGYTLRDLADQYWSIVDGRGLDRVIILGHSMGGYVAMEMIAQRPDRVSALALIHSHVFEDSEEKKTARTEILREIKSVGRNAFVRRMLQSMICKKEAYQPILDLLFDRAMAYGDEAWYYGTMAMRDRKDHEMTLKQVKVPVLMIMGGEDVIIPSAVVYRQAGLAENTQLLIYPETGHLSMYENTARLLCDLDSFLTRCIGGR